MSTLVQNCITIRLGDFGSHISEIAHRVFIRLVFLPERDYVTFGSLLSQIHLSVVCLSFVTFVHPTKGIEALGHISLPFGTLAIL